MFMTLGHKTAFICHVHSVLHDRLNVYENFQIFWKLSVYVVTYLIYISNIVVLVKQVIRKIRLHINLKASSID